MSNDNDIIRYLRAYFGKNLKANITIPTREGEFRPLPDDLHPDLAAVLKEDGIQSLYSHQLQAYQSILGGKDTVLVSRTASGKTLSFLLPVLQHYLKEANPFSVLLLYPTKALSRDQEGTLGNLLGSIINGQKLGTYDGDTPTTERENIRNSADFLLTNPDMLHSGILPNHNRKWRNFLCRLRYIIVDEVHTYRGAFGSHVANVFSRLLRICQMHGSAPIFICSSATIGNPKNHVEALYKRPFSLIDSDGSPSSHRHLALVNPSLFTTVSGAFYRRGPSSIAIPLIRYANQNGYRIICFCRGRQEVERLYHSIVQGHPGLESSIKPYRGGLLPNERRKLEKDLFSGKIKTIISTNALELGINVGELDLCILNGHPGSVASFWQQAGRVGREGKQATIVFIAKDKPIDQYIINHPEYITAARIEEAWLNAYNPYILLQHLPCAAYEKPLQPFEQTYSSEVYPQAIDVLQQKQVLKPYRGYLRYALHEYPARGVNLRGMTDYNIQIFANGRVIGELDPIGARGTLYKDAIYQHLGQKYLSLNLDLERKLCEVTPIEVDYFTEASWESMVELTNEEESYQLNGADLRFGSIHIDKEAKLYKKIKERSFENIGYGPITLPPFSYDTMGFSLLPPGSWKQEMDKLDNRYADSALYGLAYILKRSAPSLCMGDISDIDIDISLINSQPVAWQSAFFLFDSHEGGVGYAEKIYEKFSDCLQLCLAIIIECECRSGCPSCVTPQPPGVTNPEIEQLLVSSNAAVACTKSLITFLLEGRLIIPEILWETIQPVDLSQNSQDLAQQKKLRNRLHKAADILQQKRSRIH